MSKSGKARRTEQKDLEKLISLGDARVKLGDLHKEEFIIVLRKCEDNMEYEDTKRVMCRHCRNLLSKGDGGQLSRHLTRCKKRKATETLDSEDVVLIDEPDSKIRKLDYYNTKVLKVKQVEVLTKKMALYTIRSGRSYNHMSSDAVKRFVVDILNVTSCGYGQETIEQLPSRPTIQKYSEDLCEKLIVKAYEYVKPYVEKKRVNLILDHGKHVVHYLSCYASFIDDSFKLVIVPLAFIPATEGKTGAETARLITERLMQNGWSKEEVMSCAVTADGALSTLSSYFKRYIRCVSHSVNLIGCNGSDPLKFQKRCLQANEIDVLAKGKKLLDAAETLSSSIRSNSDVCQELSRLPSLPGETRWLSSLKCLKDVIDMKSQIEVIDKKLNGKGRQAYHLIFEEEIEIANSILAVFSHLISFNKVYQNQKDVALHLVLKSYKLLEEKWMKYADGIIDDVDKDSTDLEYIQILSKNALLALDKYYSEFSDYHFAAVMLCPRTKLMQQFSPREISLAKTLIESLLPSPNEPTPTNRQEDPKISNDIESLLNLVSDKYDGNATTSTELQRYLSEFVDLSAKESVEQYWRRKEKEYPNLYGVAASVYSVVPSESVCECCFSTAGFMLNKRRTRLQYSRAELVVVGSQLSAKFPDWLDTIE